MNIVIFHIRTWLNSKKPSGKLSEDRITMFGCNRLFSQLIWGKKKKRCQDAINTWNMLQELDGEVFV
jgi:hypothetical protein